jgi:hypothetical protein
MLLLVRDVTGKTAWNVMAERGNEEVLDILWDWGNEKLHL